VLDHWVTLPDGTEISIPLRVVANGDGAEVTLTLFRAPGMDDATFERDQGMVAGPGQAEGPAGVMITLRGPTPGDYGWIVQRHGFCTPGGGLGRAVRGRGGRRRGRLHQGLRPGARGLLDRRA
jgi:hypothetical protein